MAEEIIKEEAAPLIQKWAIRISRDRKSATLAPVSASQPGAMGTVDEVRQQADELGILPQFLDEEALNAAFVRKGPAEAFILAEGTEPEHPQDGKLDFHVQLGEAPRFIPDEDADKIDYKNSMKIDMVEPGQKICTIIPPVPGVPGMDVFGQQIPVGKPKPAKLLAGEGVEQKENEFFAQVLGRVNYYSGQISVRNILTIEGDVCYDTGNVRYPGTVVVMGDVKEGFEINADGDVHIGGVVEDARVVSKGSISITGGVAGREKAFVRAKKNIEVRYALNAQLEAGGDIYVTKDLANCQTYAMETVQSQNGGATGGKILARREVELDYLGSNSGVRTEARVGVDFEEEKIRNALKLVFEKGELLRNRNAVILKAASLGDHNKKAFIKDTQMVGLLLEKARQLEAALKAREQINADQDDEETEIIEPKVRIRKTLYPDVILSSPGCFLENMDLQKRSCVITPDRDSGKMVVK